MEKVQRKRKERVKIEQDISLWSVLIKREINTLLLPLFQMWIKRVKNIPETEGVQYINWRPWLVTVNIDKWERKGKLTIRSSDYGVPTEFDYDIFLAILTVHARNNIWSNISKTIHFSVQDVIKILWLSVWWRTYNMIDESISRLINTTYVFEDIWVRKKELFPNTSIQSGDDINPASQFIDNSAPEEQDVLVTVDSWSDNIVTERRIETRMIETSVRETDYEGKIGWRVLRKEYTIKISDLILENFSQKYFRYFSAWEMLSLPSGVTRRIYEIIRFQVFDRTKQTFFYKKLSEIIPLNSEPKVNKHTIIKHLKKLQDLKYIESFDDSEVDKVVICFPKNFLKQVKDSMDSNVDLVEHVKNLLKFYKRDNDTLVGDILPILENKELSPWDMKRKLETLNEILKKKDTINVGWYLRTILQNWWEKKSKKQKSIQPVQSVLGCLPIESIEPEKPKEKVIPEKIYQSIYDNFILWLDEKITFFVLNLMKKNWVWWEDMKHLSELPPSSKRKALHLLRFAWLIDGTHEEVPGEFRERLFAVSIWEWKFIL